MNLGSRNTIVPLVRMGCLFLVLGALEIQRVLLERNTLTMMWSWVATPVLTLAIVLAFLVLRERDEEESRDSVGRDRTPLWVWVAAVFCFVALFAPLAHDLSKRLWRIPVTPYQADMLPLIREGLRTFFRDGTNPYRSYLVGNWELPLTYPPALWLSFAPAYLAGMDIRYGTLFFYLLVGFVMLAHSLPGRPSSRRIVFARQTAIFLGTLLFLRLLITLRIMEHMNPVIQVVPYWAYLGLWAWAFCSKRWIFSSILLAWFLLCRPPAIVIVPFWFLFLWRNRREVPWARMIAIAAATGVAVGAAFLVQSPSVFFKDVPAYYRLVATLGMEAENPTHLFIGWARTFYLLGIHEYVTEAGLLLVGGLCVWAWFGLRTPSDTVRFAGVALFTVMTFSIFSYSYVLLDALFVLFFGVQDCVSPSRRSPKRGYSTLVAALLAAFVLTASTAIYHAARLGGFKEDGLLSVEKRSENRDLWSFHWGPVEGTPEGGFWREMRLSEPEVGVPVRGTSRRALEIQFIPSPAIEMKAPYRMVVSLNGERIGDAVLEPGRLEAPFRFTVPRRNLFRGLNAVHFSLREDLNDGGSQSRVPVPVSGVAIQSVRLTR